MLIDENLIFREYFGGTHDVYVLKDMLRKNFEIVEVVNMRNEKENNEEFSSEKYVKTKLCALSIEGHSVD